MSEYSLHRTVPIAGHYTDDGPVVELGVIDVVPEGQIIIADEPTMSDSYERQARTGLEPEEAREVADALYEMADRLEENES